MQTGCLASILIVYLQLINWFFVRFISLSSSSSKGFILNLESLENRPFLRKIMEHLE